VPWDNLSLRYESLGQHEKALAKASEAMRLDPKDRYSRQNVAAAYMSLNRFDEAKAIIDQATAQGMDLPAGSIILYGIGFARGDAATMQKAADSQKGTPTEPVLLFIRGQGECSLGKVQKARESFAQAVAAAQRYGMKEFVAILRAIEASCEAAVGNTSRAQQKALEGLAQSGDRDTRTGVATTLAWSGDVNRAGKLIDDLAKEFPTDTLLNNAYLPVAWALSEVHRGQAARAIAALEVTRPYEFGAGPTGAGYGPSCARGAAYLQARDGAKAVAEYQRILDHQGIDPTNPMCALARLGLARAYALQGETAKARTAYQDFFAAWKDADPDVPVLKEAKAEYAKLQ
jgi:tetratricopeptide (TPR) repeat protein